MSRNQRIKNNTHINSMLIKFSNNAFMSRESKNPIQCNKLFQKFSKSQGNFSNNFNQQCGNTE